MHITKVLYKKEAVTILYEEMKNGELRTTKFECDAQPLPEFVDVFAKIGEQFTELLNMAEGWDPTLTGLSISYEKANERRGLIATFTIGLEHFNSPLCLNTPLMREPIEGNAAGDTMMPRDLVELLDDMVEHAEDYLDGKRSQQTLLEDEAA